MLNHLITDALALIELSKPIYIYGSGGFGKEAYCCLKDMLTLKNTSATYTVKFIVDDEYANTHKSLNIEVVRRSELNETNIQVFVAIGHPALRRKVVESLPRNTTFISIIHPSATISDWVKLGQGSIVTAGCILTCDIEIGDHAHLNLLSTVGHDCEIGDFFTTAPGVCISGKCKIGNNVYVGTNAGIREGLEICDNVTIGMGAIVVKNINTSGIYIGNPATQLRKSD